jgi:hypothetical protein
MATLQSYKKQLSAMSKETLGNLKKGSPFKSFYKNFIQFLTHLKEVEEGILDTCEGSDDHRERINSECQELTEFGIGLLRNINIIARFTPVATLDKMVTDKFGEADTKHFMENHFFNKGEDRLNGKEPVVYLDRAKGEYELGQCAETWYANVRGALKYHFSNPKTKSFNKFAVAFVNFCSSLCLAYNCVKDNGMDVGLASEIRNYLWNDNLSKGSALERFKEWVLYLSLLDSSSMDYTLEALVNTKELDEDEIAGAWIDAWID